MKLMSVSQFPTIYLLLLPQNSVVAGCFKHIIKSIASCHNLVSVVISSGTVYNLLLYIGTHATHYTFDSDNKLMEFLSKSYSDKKIQVLVYPSMTNFYMDIINTLHPSNWCTLASRSSLYISSLGTLSYAHFVFPWSQNQSLSGFTIGTQSIEVADMRARQKYTGLFFFYNNMVSSVPYRDSCSDCFKAKQVSNSIRKLTGINNVKIQSHKPRKSSIDALEELKLLLQEHVNQF